jgi:hypothetical protein
MKIDPKATKAELLKIITDLRDEATGYHQQAKRLEERLAEAWAENITLANSRVVMMAHRKPWKLALLALAVGVVIGWVA